MICDTCGEVLNFEMIRRRNYRETGNKNLSLYLIMEIWERPEPHMSSTLYEYTLRGIYTSSEDAERVKDFLESNYEARFLKGDGPKVYTERARLNHLYGHNMFKADRVQASRSFITGKKGV